MKVVVLGGCGDMALVAVNLLNNEADVEELCIADINYEKAKKLASERAPKATAAKIDAMKPETITELVKDYDVALGFVGPFYMFEKKIANACIEAGTNYVSIMDDYDAYLEVIQLDEKAKQAGVTCICGLGNSPGITNILAKKGYLSMDEPEKINISWTGGSDEDIGPANIKHVLHIFSGTTLQWKNGHEVRVKTGTARKIVEFPAPINKVPVYYTGHAESVSVPRNLKGLKEVTLHGGAHPAYISRLAILVGKLGLTNTPKKRERLANFFTPIEKAGVFSKGGVDKSVFRIDAYGKKDGKPVHHYYTGVGHIAEITSIPCVEAALMMARGELKNPGIHAAESALEPDDFLPRLEKRGVVLNYYE
ncbi:MAG TPA: saccharopine dehydrogenase NADP-binding domain-containing protein [bacterium]|nr:saccharopine dehydrogenase NADP-binding domain-containing protein [bacterium]